jgi:hypothetical protein
LVTHFNEQQGQQFHYTVAARLTPAPRGIFTNMSKNNEHPVRAYFHALHGDTHGFLCLAQKSGSAGIENAAFEYPTQLDAAIEWIEHRGTDVYASPCLMKERPASGSRATAQNAAAMPGLWIDIDLEGMGHKSKKLPLPTLEEAENALRSLGYEHTLRVETGRGLQIYWLYRPDGKLSGNLQRWAQVNEALQERFRGMEPQRHFDSTHDLARLLRVPGTRHSAVPGHVVTAIYTDVRYDPEVLAAAFPSPAPHFDDSEPEYECSIQTAEPDSSRDEGSITSISTGCRPGDVYSAACSRNQNLLVSLLEKHGWSRAYEREGRIHLTRPGKGDGVSGNVRDGCFYCFTDSTEFVALRGYSGFSVYTKLEHNGNASLAAAALRELGYGDTKSEGELTVASIDPQAAEATIVDAWREHVPSWENVCNAIADTPMETYIAEAQRMHPDIPRGMMLADSLLLAGLLCIRQGVGVGLSADDYAIVHPNLFILKCAPAGSGKGLTSGLLCAMVDKFGLHRDKVAASSAALIDSLKPYQRDSVLLTMDEAAPLFDNAHAGYVQSRECLTELYTSGSASHRTKPAGKTCVNAVSDTWASLLLDTVPDALRGGLDAIGAGFIPRILCTHEDQYAIGYLRREAPNCSRIEQAYSRFANAEERVLIVPSECSESDMMLSMEDAERAHINRLYSLMLQKFALILHVGTNDLSGQISTETWARALIICDYFAAQALKLRRFLVADAEEALRVKLENYVQQRRSVKYASALRMMQLSEWRFRAQVLMTCVARGTLSFDEKKFIITPGGALPAIAPVEPKQRVLDILRRHPGVSRARLESTYKIPPSEIADAIERGEIKVEVGTRGAEKLVPVETSPTQPQPPSLQVVADENEKPLKRQSAPPPMEPEYDALGFEMLPVLQSDSSEEESNSPPGTWDGW